MGPATTRLLGWETLALLPAYVEVKQVHRRLDELPLWNVDECPILEEGGVQSGKSIIFDRCLLSQMSLGQVPVSACHLRQVPSPDPVASDPGELIGCSSSGRLRTRG